MDPQIARVKSAIARFLDKADGVDNFSETLAVEYNRLKRALAAAFEVMAADAVPRDEFDLADVKRAVETEMRRLFAGKAESSLLRIRRYTRPHPEIFATLAARVNSDVAAWRLRMLTGDKVHTERRTRELRDLGLDIVVREDSDSALYRLRRLEPDLTYGAAFQLRENAVRSRRLSAADKRELIALAESTAPLPPRKGAVA